MEAVNGERYGEDDECVTSTPSSLFIFDRNHYSTDVWPLKWSQRDAIKIWADNKDVFN